MHKLYVWIEVLIRMNFCIFSYRFVSGNAEHPSDKVHNATLEVLPAEPGDRVAGSTTVVTKDGYIIIGELRNLSSNALFLNLYSSLVPKFLRCHWKL